LKEGTNEISCFNCGKKGHIKRDCKSSEKSKIKSYLGKNTTYKGEWIADGRARYHMTSRRDLFKTYEVLETPTKVTMADGNTIEAIGKGTIQCIANDGQEWHEIALGEVYYLPEMTKTNLFSLGAATDKGYVVKQTANKIEIIDEDGKTTLVGNRSQENLWILEIKGIPQRERYSARADILTWHKRLGHPSEKIMKKIQNEESTQGLEIIDTLQEVMCNECPAGRMVRLPCNEVEAVKGKLGEHLSAGLCGPMQVESLGVARYFMIIKDRVSGYRQVYFLKTKKSRSSLNNQKPHTDDKESNWKQSQNPEN
jgi:hypothetical protein